MRISAFTLLAVLVPLSWALSQSPRNDGPLTEDGVTRLVLSLKIKPEAVVRMVGTRGVGFPVDDPAIDRLKKAGVPDLVLDSIREAAKKAEVAKKARAASDPGADPAVTYDQVAEMVRLQVPDEDIRERIKGSVFTLGKDQAAELRKLGASEGLLKDLTATKSLDPAREIANLAILLDCSGSMSEPTPDGSTKMDAAKTAAIELIRKSPEGLHLSFIIYGHDKALRCEAVKVVRPLGPIDGSGKEELIGLVRAMEPAGSTPIGLALSVAGKELANAQGPSGVVLVSDGKEMCGGDPATEAASLAKKLKLGFGVQVVGFGVKPDEKLALGEIAKAGQGNYYDAPTAAKLQDVAMLLAKAVETGKKPILEESGSPTKKVATAPAMTARVKLLVNQLRDPSYQIRRSAAEGLGRLGKEAEPAVPALVERVTDDYWVDIFDNGDSKNAALKVLVRLAPEKTLDALMQTYKSGQLAIRIWALQKLAEFARVRPEGETITPRMTAAAAASLDQRLNILIKGLKDDEYRVRRVAADLLNFLGNDAKPAIPALVERVTDDYWVDIFDNGDSKKAALAVLRKLAPNEVEGALFKAAESKNNAIRQWATTILTQAPADKP